MAAQQPAPIILIKRRKSGGGGHHGGSWKVAYADFVTAMMAFFMVMWLVTSTPEEKLGGIAEFFKNPSAVKGAAQTSTPGRMGPGGAGDSPINIFQASRNPPGAGDAKVPGIGSEGKPTPDAAKEKQDREKLEELRRTLNKAIQASQAMAPFKDQLLIDVTPEGLRIQIIDALDRPMFDLGSPELKPYTRALLVELANYLDQVPNRVAITGHTDTTPYRAQDGYTNWELSSERASAARRALVAGGLSEAKLARVVGLSSSVLFNKADPTDPKNRRISLVVLSAEAERMAERIDAPRTPNDGRANDPAPIPTAGVLPSKRSGIAARQLD